MDITKITEERHELLERLQDSLQEELIACEIRMPENEGEPEILTVVLDGSGDGDETEGAIGEFFFLPVSSEEDRVQYFSAVVTLRDDIPEENLPALFEAMSYINFGLPCGGYCIGGEGSFLAYKLTVPLPAGLGGEDLYEEMNVIVGNAVNASDLYSDILLRIADGEEIEYTSGV